MDSGESITIILIALVGVILGLFLSKNLTEQPLDIISKDELLKRGVIEYHPSTGELQYTNEYKIEK